MSEAILLTELTKLKLVAETVAEYYKITVEDMRKEDSKNTTNKGSRKHMYVEPRQISMYLIKDYLKSPISLVSIGVFFGGRDHSTVINAIQVTQDRIDVNRDFRDKIEYIKADIFDVLN